MKGERIDKLLVDRGLAPSRTKAQALVMSGVVLVDEQLVNKPSETFAANAIIRLKGLDDAAAKYVGRGGLKLAAALREFHLDVSGLICLDVGASTGGFTDCLLQNGARKVVAVDVGHNQIDWRLRNDPAVTVIERRNARELTSEELPYRPDLVVADLSFISLTKVLPTLLDATAAQWDCVALVKPQFEVGRERVGKGGVVRGSEDRRAALIDIGQWAAQSGHTVLGYASSGLPGPAGNLESFIWIAENGRPGAVESIKEAAREVEP